MLFQIYKTIAILIITIMSTYARSIITDSELLTALVGKSIQRNGGPTQVENENLISRKKRQAYYPGNTDYYANYYNDYYNNYYNGISNSIGGGGGSGGSGSNKIRPSADRFDDGTVGTSVDDRQDDFNGQSQSQNINGQKYVYTPLFQYKATHQKRKKLFVPNLFG